MKSRKGVYTALLAATLSICMAAEPVLAAEILTPAEAASAASVDETEAETVIEEVTETVGENLTETEAFTEEAESVSETEEKTEATETETETEETELLVNESESQSETEDETESQTDGWQDNENGTKSYYKDGAAVTGLQTIEGKKYYFDPATAEMQTGLVTVEDKVYGFGQDGAMLYGEQKLEGKWRWFNKNTGEMVTGWKTIPGGRTGKKKVYYGEDGGMFYGEHKIDGFWYWFDQSGEVVTSDFRTIPGGKTGKKKVYYNADGHMVYGEYKVNGHWHWFDQSGEMAAADFRTIKGGKTGRKKVYYDANGWMVYGERKIDGHWYYFSKASGEMTTGFATIPGGKTGRKKVYYDANGWMVYGERKIDGHWHYFSKASGEMITGFATIPGGKTGRKKVYYNADGWMLYGEQKIDGSYYYFSKASGELEWKDRRYQNPAGYYQIHDSNIRLTMDNYFVTVGDEGLIVAQVIKDLRRRGYYSGSYVGMGGAYFGNSLRSAVMSFQRANGLTADGYVGPATWAALGHDRAFWDYLGAYASPLQINRNSSREDCIEAMIDRAYDYLGDDYVIGASGAPGYGLDCSGLVMQALFAAGIDMSPINPVRHANINYEYESANIYTSPYLKHVSYSERERGDIIIYGKNGSVVHSAIYLGGNRIIESWPDVVQTNGINAHSCYVMAVLRVFN